MADEEKQKIEFDVNKTWLGIGAKGGGTLFFIGLEETEGYVWHLGTPTTYSFSVMALRIGAGLGASVGLVAICIFNCDNPLVQLNKTSLNDWGVNISIGGKASKVFKALKQARFWALIGKMGTKGGAKALKNAEQIRGILHTQ